MNHNIIWMWPLCCAWGESTREWVGIRREKWVTRQELTGLQLVLH